MWQQVMGKTKQAKGGFLFYTGRPHSGEIQTETPKNGGQELPGRRIFHREEGKSCGKGPVLGGHYTLPRAVMWTIENSTSYLRAERPDLDLGSQSL